ncbi:MAG: threonine-phosphate decarboxylase, partial [Nitratireductor sp.]
MALQRAEKTAVSDHGGSLDAARALFADAPQPWVDLSTGINPHAYPLFDLPATAFSRL